MSASSLPEFDTTGAFARLAAAVATGLQIADPLIGLAIMLVILRITWGSWKTVRGYDHA